MLSIWRTVLFAFLLPLQQPAGDLNTYADRLSRAGSVAEQQAILDEKGAPLTAALSELLAGRGDDQRLKERNLHEAIRLYGLAVAIAERSGDGRATANARSGMGIAYSGDGQFEMALESLRRSADYFEAIDDGRGLSNIYNSMALAFRRQGDSEKAIEVFKRAVAIAEKTENPETIARALLNLGNTYVQSGQFVAAVQVLERCLAISEAANIEAGIGFATNSLGNLYRAQGNNELAIDFYQRSLKVKEKIGNFADMLTTLSSFASTYLAMGKLDLALQFAERGLALNQGRDRRMQADLLINYGAILMAKKNDAEALKKIEEGLAINEEIRNGRSIVEGLERVSRIHLSAGRLDLALKAAERGVEIATSLASLPQQAETHDLAGLVYQRLQRWDDAEKAFRQSIAAVEELQSLVAGDAEQQEAFLEDRNQPYKDLVGLLVGRGRLDEAFRIAEREKARVLLNMMQRDRVQVSKELSDNERQQERGLQSQIAWLNTELSRLNPPLPAAADRAKGLKVRLDQTRLQLSAFQTRLYAAHPVLQTQRGTTPTITLADTQTLLADDKTVLLEYTVTEGRTLLFAIRSRNGKPELSAFTIEVGNETLEGKVQGFQNSIATRNLDYRDASESLYQLLIAPAAALLQGARTVVIVPDQSLWHLPFQALSNSAKRYMIEDHAIFLAPSLTFLREIRRNEDPINRAPRLFAMANPGSGPDALVNADREARELADVYGKSASRIYTQKAASEDTAKAESSGFDVVHFATHGVFNDTHPMYSHLVLTTSGKDPLDDGLLEAREMMNLKLKATVVVLSACETARGKVGGGEGLVGMMWALFIAGSPTTVASQWKVDSAGTTDLMIRFHQGLRAHFANPSALRNKAMALQDAALSIMKKPEYRHPFYWAGFVMVGNGF